MFARTAKFDMVVRNDPISPVSPTVNQFLFADVGVEANGMVLSVLSALSRQGIDPWEEAKQLSNIPKKKAVRRLAQTIEDMPGSLWPMSAATAIAARLVVLLPAHELKESCSISNEPGDGTTTRLLEQGRQKGSWRLFYALALLGAVMIGFTLTIVARPPARLQAKTMEHQATSSAASPSITFPHVAKSS
jgi:hypothetical protein